MCWSPEEYRGGASLIVSEVVYISTRILVSFYGGLRFHEKYRSFEKGRGTHKQEGTR